MTSRAANKTKQVKIEDLDVEKVNYDGLKIKKYPSGYESKICKMNYNGERFIIQTNQTVAPFGVTNNLNFMKDDDKKLVEEGKKWLKYSLEFNIEGDDLDALLDLDDANIDYVSKNSEQWFGEGSTPNEVRKFSYNSLIKKNKAEKGDYPDRFKVNLPFYQGEPKFKIYGTDNKEISFCTIVGGAPVLDWSWAQQQMKVEVLCECEGMKLVNGKAYCSFKAVQLRVQAPESLPDCAFGAPIEEVTKTVEKLQIESPGVYRTEEEEDLEVEED